jgi:hypothetical protein
VLVHLLLSWCLSCCPGGACLLLLRCPCSINNNMLLNEFFHKDPEAYQDLSQDNSQPQASDLRKTRLTLRQLNKLRK